MKRSQEEKKLPKWYKTGSPTLWLRSRNRLEELFRWIPKIHDVLEPEIVGVLDANSIYTMLKKKGFEHIFLSDELYQITNLESIQRFLILDETDQVKYVPIGMIATISPFDSWDNFIEENGVVSRLE